MDRLDDMALFARVAETRSFTVAAAKLGLSRSAASRRLTELEARLGARLLNRTTRRISLTEAGETYLVRVQQILADVDEADRSVASLQTAPRGVLKVAAPMSFGMQHLGPAIADFLSAFPDIEVEMDLNDRFVDLVDEGYDVAVRIGQLKDSSLVAKRICPARVVHAASPAYLTRRGVPRAPEDLAQHDCLIYTNIPQGAQWLFRATPLTPRGSAGRQPRPRRGHPAGEGQRPPARQQRRRAAGGRLRRRRHRGPAHLHLRQGPGGGPGGAHPAGMGGEPQRHQRRLPRQPPLVIQGPRLRRLPGRPLRPQPLLGRGLEAGLSNPSPPLPPFMERSDKDATASAGDFRGA
ncbi:transcriptional regulator, LysR family protein [Nitrospirillum viridazoti Y2]|uniref:LysR substrate-binding domain-containing protein n=1 Tax=Nitrospirillum viridazoti TaxID=3144925 RepID=UPI0002265760|nr:transcriptional regulator, LysR family protein [Nitrospirillum amazonense Y2]